MTQTRTFLFLAWLFVAFLIWDAWTKDEVAPAPAPAANPAAVASDTGVPSAPSANAIPAAPSTQAPDAPAPTDAAATASETPVSVGTDLLRVTLDGRGGSVQSAELLDYGQTGSADSPRVELLSSQPAHYFVARFGLTSNQDAKPSHEAAFRPVGGRTEFALADGQDRLEVPFEWTHESGLRVRRSYVFERGSYVMTVREEIENTGASAWTGAAYCQMQRVPPVIVRTGFTSPESYSFAGGVWYSPQEKFNKVKFDEFAEEAATPRQVQGGWVAMLQHYFMAACIPPSEATTNVSFAAAPQDSRTVYRLTSVGPSVSVAPGASASNETRVWIGPKLQDVLPDVAPGLERTSDYGIFTIIAEPLYWVLSWLHALFGNWGWAIIGLVVLIKLVFFKLSETQYKSFAKMRAVQPRIESLKERYGDDRQKFQMAMMELYKKEKINPMGGCLPILVQIPVFIALYWVLLESVELRHAPWMGWIQSLTDRDPYFVLPALNMLTMWLTQKMTPSPGMDPMQKKIMQIMPLAFGVMFAFFPAGLVLYWCTNGVLGLAQQWIITKRHGGPAKA